MTTDATEINEVLRQIGEGRGHIDAQKMRIAQLSGSGNDTGDADAFLARLEEGQQGYVDRLDELEKRLGGTTQSS
jgi:hypothetical protein